MMPARTFIDLSGQIFSRLTVVSRAENSLRGLARWNCICVCGKETVVPSGHLRSGNTTSCGCFGRERRIAGSTLHGRSKTAEFNSWALMLDRCGNPNNNRWKRYGGRGIAICERWRSFENFFADMGPKPAPKHSIERIDNDGNYEPGNCKWATRLEQANNICTNHVVVFQGRKMSLADAHRIGLPAVSLSNVYNRITRGWTFEDAMFTPLLSQADRENRKRSARSAA